MVFWDWLGSTVSHPGKYDSEIRREKRKTADAKDKSTEPAVKPPKHHRHGHGSGSSKRHTHRCVTAQEFLDHVLAHDMSADDDRKIETGRDYISKEILPVLDEQGGSGVPAKDMEKVVDLFAKAVFFTPAIFGRALDTTNVVWRQGLPIPEGKGSACNDAGTLISLDPNPKGPDDGQQRGDRILSSLLHQTIAAILRQLVCRGQCGKGEHRQIWSEQVQQGSALLELAQYAEKSVNRDGLFRARLGVAHLQEGSRETSTI